MGYLAHVERKDHRRAALWALAGRLDADPWRRQFRELLTQIDAGQTPDANAVGALERLAVSPDLALQPPAALHHLGMALSQGHGNAELGSRVLRVAHRQYPGDFWINGALAWTLASLGSDHQEEALAFSFATLALRPKVGWSWYRIGSIHQFHHKNLDAANDCYQKALELDAKNAWMHNAVGWALWNQKKPDEAVVRFRKAIELDPTIAAPLSSLGGVLREQNKLDEAIVAYRKAVAIYEGAPEQGRVKRIETLVGLGNALRTRKQRDEASAAYRKALELDPKNANSFYGLGIMLLENSVDRWQIDEAIACLKQGIEADPKHVHCHWALGRAMGKLKKFDDAVACFQKCIELNPYYADSYWGLGFVLLDQKKVDEAVPAFRKAVELKPDHSFAQFGLARALAELNQTDEAIMVFIKSLELDPTRVDGHYRLGLLFREQNKPEAASACFRNALELDPNHAAARKQLESIHGSSGQPADTKP